MKALIYTRGFYLTVILYTLLLLTGCAENQSFNFFHSDTGTEATYGDSDVNPDVIQAQNTFGMTVFQHVAGGQEENENVFLSPFSISMALAMTYNGADGETKEAMARTLNVHDLDHGSESVIPGP